MHGYNSYDYSARMMYPAIGGRFMTVDPLAEDDPDVSSYVYCGDNPVNRVDPDGRFWNYVVGGVAGGLMEIGTQVAANALTGNDLTNVNWKKVGVSTIEGALTSGSSVVMKVVSSVGAAAAQSAIDNSDKGIEEIAIGTAVNLGSGAIGSGAAKVAKGVGSKTLERGANKAVGSKSAITRTVQGITKTNSKTARMVATTLQNGEKAAAKQIRKADQSAVKSVASGVASGTYDNLNPKIKR